MNGVTLESLVTYAIMGVVLVFVCSWIFGQPLSLSFKRPTRPTLWDLVPIAYAVYMPVVGAVIDNGFVASVVVVLTGIALVLAWRRFGPPRAETAPPAPR